MAKIISKTIDYLNSEIRVNRTKKDYISEILSIKNQGASKTKRGIRVAFLLLILLISSTGGILNNNDPERAVQAANTKFVGLGQRYLKIQDAIDDANPGDIIFVENGTYYEQLSIYKNITLIGKDWNSTIIRNTGVGDVIVITASEVNISNFNISNDVGKANSIGIYLYGAQNCEVSKCKVHSNSYLGILIENSQNIVISDNNISDNGYGIYIQKSIDNIVMNNRISRNQNYGILIEEAANDNFIDNNTVFSNNQYGIYILNSVQNTISNNNISGNMYGIFIFSSSRNFIANNFIYNNWGYGIYQFNSSSNIIVENNISNGEMGIYIYSSENGKVMNNTMFNTGFFIMGHSIEDWNTHNIDITNIINGEPIYYWKNRSGGVVPKSAAQIILANCTNVHVENQEVSDTSMGIELGFSNYNIIANNTVSLTHRYGITLYYSENNTIINNTAFYNNAGIRLYYSTNNTILNNNVSSNHWANIYFTSATYNNIVNNTISFSFEYYSTDLNIYLDRSSHNKIMNNKMSLKYGNTIYISYSTNITIINNQMVDNGIYIEGDLLKHWGSHHIDSTNTINDKPIYYWTDRNTGTVPKDAAQVILVNCTNVLVSHQNIINISMGIALSFSSKNSIIKNNVLNSWYGIFNYKSDQNIITDNNLSDNGEGIYLGSSCDNKLINNILTENRDAIYLYSSSNNTVTDNIALSNFKYGITLSSSSYNTIAQNVIWNSSHGINFYHSSRNIIRNNTLYINYNTGISIDDDSSTNNFIYHNNFIGNMIQAVDSIGRNHWNTSYPVGGNFWSDYVGMDDYKGSNQDIIGSDGIGDRPYMLTKEFNIIQIQDKYPFLDPLLFPVTMHLPPTAPSDVLAIGNYGYITLTWSEPMFDGGLPITGYKIYRGNCSGGEELLTTINDENIFSFYDLNITDFKTYYYRLSAENNFSEGPNSNEVEAASTEPPVITSEKKKKEDDWSYLRCMLSGIILLLVISALITKFVLLKRLRKGLKSPKDTLIPEQTGESSRQNINSPDTVVEPPKKGPGNLI